jgi:predicted MFS family arabinose efflux permease
VSVSAVVGVVGAVQCVNILDFMMVMPLGPDLAASLGIDTSSLGVIGGSYTAAAAVSGLLGLFFLDRFPRRTALIVAMLGLALGTAAGAFATDLPTLLLARVVAGAFGGPATSIAMSIITDVVPPERRGRAMGAVMGAFSVASVLGVPLGLELAARSTWRAPFYVVAGLGLLLTLVARLLLPRLDGHLVGGARPRMDVTRVLALVRRPEAQLTALLVAAANLSGFMFIPNVSALLQLNLGYPRDGLGLLYLTGGAVSFFTMRGAGQIVDRFGSTVLIAVGVTGIGVLMGVLGVLQDPRTPVVAAFALFMVFSSGRNVSLQTLTSKVPRPDERAGFQSIQSAIQHAAAAMGAMSSSVLLSEVDGRLSGVPMLVAVATAVSTLMVPAAFLLERRLKRPG